MIPDNINIQQLIQTYSTMVQRSETALQNLPEGNIQSNLHHKRYPQYYFYITDPVTKKKTRKYIPKSDMSLVRDLVQREYEHTFLQELKKQLKVLENLSSNFNPSILAEVYEKLPPAKKLLVKPHILPTDDFVKQWYEKNPGNQNPYPFPDSYETENKEMVRSKSEKIIADKLFLKGIPYRYETALYVKKYGTIFPDFTILNVRTRKTYYFEHFGKMDDPDYCKHTLEKISLYQKQGYALGDQFLFTMESSQKSIDLPLLDQMISQYFL